MSLALDPDKCPVAARGPGDGHVAAMQLGEPGSWPADPAILSLIADAIVSTDGAGNIVLFNKAAEEMFGYNAGEVIGRPVEILLPRPARQGHRRSVLDFANSEQPDRRMMGNRREVVGSRKNGDEFAIEASLSRWFVDGCPLLTAVIRDTSERKRIDDAKALVAAEMAHRFKNSIAVVNSIVSLTARGALSVKEFAAALHGRISAMARTYDILFQPGAQTADIRTLIESELFPYRSRDGGNVEMSGAPLRLPPRAAVNLGLVLHELATNAAKYGALSRLKGRISIAWRIDEAGGAQSVVLDWIESGGPRVSPPLRRGFGTELIQRCFGAGARIDYRRTGLRARIEFLLETDSARIRGEDS